MWRLTATLLLASLASLASASPKPGYYYQRPSPSFNPVCPAVTSTVLDTRLETTVHVTTVNVDSTQVVTSTVLKQQTVPITFFQTRIRTQVQIQTSVARSTTNKFRDVVVTQTVQGSDTQQTRFITTTRVVPQISFITQTETRTQVIPVEVTRTQMQTITQTITSFTTQTLLQTRIFTIREPDVVRTRVQTVLQTSLVRVTEPGRTSVVTSTVVQQQVQTTTVRGQDVLRTSLVQSQQVIPFTAFNTRFETATVTREVVVTRTNVITQTQFQTQFVTQQVVQTQVVPTTIFTTVLQTQFHPITQVQTVIQTNFVIVGGGVQTQEVTRTSVVQVSGQDSIITKEVFRTRSSQQVIYKTVTRPRNVVLTRTVTGSCRPVIDSYDYQMPHGYY